MSECLNFVFENQRSATDITFPLLCEEHLGRKPFWDSQRDDQRFKTWRVPNGNDKLAVTILGDLSIVETSYDWDFLWEVSVRKLYLNLADELGRLFSSSFVVLAPSGLVIGPAELILLNFENGVESALKNYFGETRSLNNSTLTEAERHCAERKIAFIHHPNLSPH
tara:strand:- start:497 stop:994 length:498 start_codon:yes stop_codon:yes gene_type:complete